MNRTFILPGQFGIVGSIGTYVADQLAAFGSVFVEPGFTGWRGLESLRQLRGLDWKKGRDRIAVVGYSLGANETAWIAQQVHDKMLIDMIVAYDPSRQSPLAVGGVQSVPSNVNRAVCYYNPTAWYYGGARFVGDTVENMRIDMLHLAVCNDYGLHKRTIEAVKAAFRVSVDA